MKKLYYILFIILPVVVFPQQNRCPFSLLIHQWKHVGDEGVSPGNAVSESLAFNQSGEPFIAYQDYSTSDNGRATVMKFNDTVWENVGNANFTDGPAFYISLAVSPSGEPYVAFMDYVHNEKASVMKFDGTGWVYVGSQGFSLGTPFHIDLAFSSSGEPYIAYSDRLTAYDQKATVMRFDGSDWVNVGSAGFTQGDAYYTSLAFGPDGNPYVAFEECGNNCKASVMKFDGTNWVNVGSPGFSPGDVWYVSLAFNQDGIPYVAFDDCGHLSKTSVMKLYGNNWGYVGTPGFSQGSALFVSLAFGQDGDPYVAFQEWNNSSKATVMKLEGTNWEYFGGEGFSDGRADYTSIVFSPSGTPYVAFSDYENDSRATVMKYDSVFVGINEPRETRLYIYPNPANDKITIQVPGKAKEGNLTITDTYGRELIKHKITDSKTEINISYIPVGVYFIRLINDTSIEFGTFIKE